jgi:KDO2-lipid IV(A) lauroyltransferase
MKRDTPTKTDRLVDGAFRGLLRLALALPYHRRVPLFGWFAARIAAPLAGWDRRVRDNLAHVAPELPAAEVRRLVRRVPDNFGRALIEVYSGDDFIERVRDAPLEGPGMPALEAARREGRPVVMVTGHFGNYEASRIAFLARGYRIGVLYNPMQNPLFNAHYVAAMSHIGTPVFARGRRGMAGMLRFLRDGGMLGVVADQHMPHGEPLNFMGQPAWTALSVAEMGLKYDALVVPIYAVRRPDGLSFDIRVEAPVPHGPPEEMMQALNDSLSRLVRDHMDQWFWIHRRWKRPPGM